MIVQMHNEDEDKVKANNMHLQEIIQDRMMGNDPPNGQNFVQLKHNTTTKSTA